MDPGPSTLAGYSTLKYGARGNITKLLQEKLMKLEYETNGVDEIFGDKTLQALIRYQEKNKLSVEGIVGQFT